MVLIYEKRKIQKKIIRDMKILRKVSMHREKFNKGRKR